MAPTRRLAVITAAVLSIPALACAWPLPAAQAQDDLVGFTSPSGNIGCVMDSRQVRCDIAERDWAPPPPPQDCPLDYGQGISLDAGGAAGWVCAGDTALAAGPPLPFGESAAAGDLRCDSAPSGMTCRDVTTGRGFSIAREGFRMF